MMDVFDAFALIVPLASVDTGSVSPSEIFGWLSLAAPVLPTFSAYQDRVNAIAAMMTSAMIGISI
jgi:hypothetical protein